MTTVGVKGLINCAASVRRNWTSYSLMCLDVYKVIRDCVTVLCVNHSSNCLMPWEAFQLQGVLKDADRISIVQCSDVVGLSTFQKPVPEIISSTFWTASLSGVNCRTLEWLNRKRKCPRDVNEAMLRSRPRPKPGGTRPRPKILALRPSLVVTDRVRCLSFFTLRAKANFFERWLLAYLNLLIYLLSFLFT